MRGFFALGQGVGRVLYNWGMTHLRHGIAVAFLLVGVGLSVAQSVRPPFFPPAQPRVVYPAPVLSSPRTDATVSAAPVFRVQVSTAAVSPITYQVEVRRVGETAVRTFSSGLTQTNQLTTIPVPLTAGFSTGNYEWRARGVDENNITGVWSGWRPFLASGGIDAAGTVTLSAFQQFKAAGWDSHFQASWGGRNTWPAARQNLLNAHAAGLKVAAYVFLNFDNGSTITGAPANQSGDWQVDRAFANIGWTGTKDSLGFPLKFMMIDIENQFMGTMTTDERVQRIAEAVQRVRNLGFRTMIYTRNEGVNQWWNLYTGSSTDFRELPLWGSKPELATATFKDDLELDLGSPWVRFGGWQERAGKQCLLDVSTFGARVDYNVWDPAIWNLPDVSAGRPVIPRPTATISRQGDGTYRMTLTIANTGTVEAYAVRVRNWRLRFTNLPGTVSVGTVNAGGTKQAVGIFPASTGTPGTSTIAQFEIWTGNGPLSYAVSVTLP